MRPTTERFLLRRLQPSSTNKLRISLVPNLCPRGAGERGQGRGTAGGGAAPEARSGEGDAVKAFAELTEQEILALAISAEEEDARIYADYADGLKADFPASAQVFTEMADEENEHRRRLIELHRERFGEHIPLIRRQDVKGFVKHEPVWMVRPLGLDKVRKQAE